MIEDRSNHPHSTLRQQEMIREALRLQLAEFAQGPSKSRLQQMLARLRQRFAARRTQAPEAQPVLDTQDVPLITASDTAGFAHIWDVSTKAELHRLSGHTATIWTALFSPDGTRIVTSSWDGTARILDAASGKTIRVLDNGRSKPLYWAEFSPDGNYVVTGGEQDDRIDVWRVDLEVIITALCDRPLAELAQTQRVQYGITDNEPICPISDPVSG